MHTVKLRLWAVAWAAVLRLYSRVEIVGSCIGIMGSCFRIMGSYFKIAHSKVEIAGSCIRIKGSCFKIAHRNKGQKDISNTVLINVS